MERRLLTSQGLLDSVNAYAQQKDLRKDPRLSVDTLFKLVLNGYGYRVDEESKFYELLKEICEDPDSGFELDKDSFIDGRPTVFYKTGFRTPKKMDGPPACSS